MTLCNIIVNIVYMYACVCVCVCVCVSVTKHIFISLSSVYEVQKYVIHSVFSFMCTCVSVARTCNIIVNIVYMYAFLSVYNCSIGNHHCHQY